MAAPRFSVVKQAASPASSASDIQTINAVRGIYCVTAGWLWATFWAAVSMGVWVIALKRGIVHEDGLYALSVTVGLVCPSIAIGTLFGKPRRGLQVGCFLALGVVLTLRYMHRII